MKLSFNIAKRFLSYNKGQTILIVLGIAIGISVQIFIGLLIAGLQDSLVDKTIGSTPHITITSETRGETFKLDEALLAKLEADPAYTHVGYSITWPALATGNQLTQSILLKGLSDESVAIAKIDTKIEEGQLPKENEAVLGKGLAEQLKLKVGDTIDVSTGATTTNPLKVSGIADLKVAVLNDSWVVVNPKVAQDILYYDGLISAIEIQVKDVFAADTLATLVPVVDGLKVTDWKASNAELLSGLNGQSVSTYMIQVFVLISVVLGIASTLAITVLQKSRQIGILKAMGIRDGQASLIFMFQGLILGFFGGLLGMGLGYGLLKMFSTFAKGADGNPIIPITFDLPFILISGSIAIVSALVASVIPARKSQKLSPIEVIRNG